VHHYFILIVIRLFESIMIFISWNLKVGEVIGFLFLPTVNRYCGMKTI
jgi:hypothetical protein